jgi:hypothetical protein
MPEIMEPQVTGEEVDKLSVFLDRYICSLPNKEETHLNWGSERIIAGDLKKAPYFGILFQAWLEGFDSLKTRLRSCFL